MPSTSSSSSRRHDRSRLPSRRSFKYGEYQDECSTAQLLSRTCFDALTTTELFDLEKDPSPTAARADRPAPPLATSG